MKTKFVFSTLAAFLLGAATASSTEWIGGMVSTDTLYPGQVNVIQMNAGYGYQIENLVARLNTHYGREFPIRCQGWYEDTIWAADIQPYNDTLVTLTFDIPASAFPGDWYLDLNDGAMHYSPMLMFTRTYISSQPLDVTVCLGGTASIDVCAYAYHKMEFEWFHDGESLQSGYDLDSLVVRNVDFADTGTYYCMMKDWTGEWTGSDTVHLRLQGMNDDPGMPEGPAELGYPQSPVYYSVRYDEAVTWYNWVLIPQSAGTFGSQGDSTIAVTWNGDFKGTAGLFVETTLGECRGLNSDTLWINVAGVPDAQEICIVGLDKETEKCRIVWNKSTDPAVASYIIYRESNQAGVFLPLAEIPASGPSVYIDSTSVPESHSQSYRMTLVDTNGTESVPGTIHRTMLLSSSLGTGGEHNLSWNHYEGFPFLSYEIYSGPSKDSMSHLETIASNISSRKINNPPGGQVYYQIVVRRDGQCNPDLKSDIDYSETRSNIEEFLAGGVQPRYSGDRLKISPNPANASLRVSYAGNGAAGADITLVNLLGQVCASYPVVPGIRVIDVSGIAPGLYLLRLEEADGVLIRKLVIKR